MESTELAVSCRRKVRYDVLLCLRNRGVHLTSIGTRLAWRRICCGMRSICRKGELRVANIALNVRNCRFVLLYGVTFANVWFQLLCSVLGKHLNEVQLRDQRT